MHTIALKLSQIFKHAYINVFTLKTEKARMRDCSGFLQIESQMYRILACMPNKSYAMQSVTIYLDMENSC